MRRSSSTVAFLVCVAAVSLAGCGQKAAAPAASGTPIGAAAVDAEAQAAAEAKAAELAAKEQELAEREAALKQQELDAEKAKQEAEAAAAAAAAQKAAASKRTTTKTASSSTAPAKAAAPATPIAVPAGTQLAVALGSAVDTKTVTVGAPVQGTLASDLVVDGRRAAKAGAAVQGSVTQVISGSHKIGGVPTIGLRFDTLVAADGSTKTINASYVQQAKSDTGKDTAKIVGGAAVGAVIGHQVDSDKGSVIGGLLGAGAGAAAAKKTGGEIQLAAGQVLNVSTTTGFEVRP
ncbi:MAG TPA: glycine zipper 2TM domain-containing protein [Steroidobacteraceae bacterium]|nr:glycine zipper 2TM domain-containing protein [Steroidobacteraceae bacterium]